MGLGRLVLNGRIDINRASQVRRDAVEFAAQHQNKIIVDLHQVPFIDSSGVGAIISIFYTIRQAGGTFYLYGLQPPVQMVIELVGFNQILPILKTEADLRAAMVGSEPVAIVWYN